MTSSSSTIKTFAMVAYHDRGSGHATGSNGRERVVTIW
jgi:hypothetical protein